MKSDAINKPELDLLYKEYGQFEWTYLKTAEEVRALSSLDILAYTIYLPGAQGYPGFAFFLTNRSMAYAMYYCGEELTYDDLRSILPELPERFEDLKPWGADRYQNIGGWYWYGLHSGCYARIHESIWPTFYGLCQKFSNIWIAPYWSTFARKAIAVRDSELESYLSGIEHYGIKYDCATEEAQEVACLGVVAWRESQHGWDGLLCKNGKSYFKLPLGYDDLQIPISKREDIRNNTLPGWECIYCGLGHFLIIKDEYYPGFCKLSYGMGKNNKLYTNGFDILCAAIKNKE